MKLSVSITLDVGGKIKNLVHKSQKSALFEAAY